MKYREIQAVPRLYHGTCTGNLATIRTQGLLATETKPKGGVRRHGVYLTDDQPIASEYGWLMCDLRHHGEHDIVILEINPAYLHRNLLQPDDYDLQDAVQGGEVANSEPIDPRLKEYTSWNQVPWALSLAVVNQVFYAGSIPARALSQL